MLLQHCLGINFSTSISPVATGIVELSGRVEEHQLGFRAQRAKIIQLHSRLSDNGMPLRLVRAGQLYEVPVVPIQPSGHYDNS